MRNRNREAAHRNQFYAGRNKPTVLCEERFSIEAEGSDACLICFVQEGKEERLWFGLYEDDRILPLTDAYEQIAREMSGEAWTRGAASSVPVPLRTALTKARYMRYRNERPPTPKADEDPTIFTMRRPLDRWQYALLLAAAFSILSLCMGMRLIWSGFFLLNGTFVSQMKAARIFYAWAIPLTLFNAVVYRGPRETFTVLLFGACPLAIRSISLMRNYSLTAMWVCALAVIAVAAGTALRSRRIAGSLRGGLETGRLAGACALMLAFSALMIVDLWVPKIGRREVKAPDTAVADGERIVSEETIDFLNSDAFESASAERKAQVLLEIAREISNEMGIECPRIVIEAQMDGSCDAYYQWEDHTISLWKPVLERSGAFEATETVLHELYHAYQNAIIHSPAVNWEDPDTEKLLYFRIVNQWRADQERYVAPDRWGTNVEEYYEQSIESDAYDFSRRSARFYVDTAAEDEAAENGGS